MVGGVESFHQVDEGNKGCQIVLAVRVKDGLQSERPVMAAHLGGGTKLCLDVMLAEEAIEFLVQNATEDFGAVTWALQK